MQTNDVQNTKISYINNSDGINYDKESKQKCLSIKQEHCYYFLNKQNYEYVFYKIHNNLILYKVSYFLNTKAWSPKL